MYLVLPRVLESYSQIDVMFNNYVIWLNVGYTGTQIHYHALINIVTYLLKALLELV